MFQSTNQQLINHHVTIHHSKNISSRPRLRNAQRPPSCPASSERHRHAAATCGPCVRPRKGKPKGRTGAGYRWLKYLGYSSNYRWRYKRIVCTYVCIYNYIHTYKHVYIYIYIYINIYIHINTDLSGYISTY